MAENLQTTILTLPEGQIKGAKKQTIYEQDYYSFEGIPYGKPPLGELRFKAPQPAAPWKGVRDCTHCASKPLQKFEYTTGVPNKEFAHVIVGSEDCLYLNVYAKTLKSAKPLPVLVFIYGGAFVVGEATSDLYSPDYFMQQDVVLVTLNYRLCSLGFLSLSDPELQVPGNAGLKDQVLALKWIKAHIAHFNGDNNNITLFGMSAGGASTHFMMLTEQTRGLFHKAIPMSGVVLNKWAYVPQTDSAYRLAKYHGYTGENVDKDVLAYLRALEPHQLVDHDLMTDEDHRNGLLVVIGPTVEPYISEDCVVPKDPFELLKTAWSNEIPIMIGGTSFEGLMLYPRAKQIPSSVTAFAKDPTRALPQEVREAHNDAENKNLAEQLIRLHFGDKKPNEQTILSLLDLYSHKFFWHGLHRTALARLAYAKAPTYLYRFDFDSPTFNRYRIRFCGTDVKEGVSHADDVAYLFHANIAWKLATDSIEYKTIQRMVGIWTTFAKNSDPNCSEIKPATWQPLTKSEPYKALNISNDVELLVELPEKSKLEVWNTLYKVEKLF